MAHIIKEILVIALMSVITSVVCAQTPKNDVAKLSDDDKAMILRTMESLEYFENRDSLMTMMLLDNNTPHEGIIKEAGQILDSAKVGDQFVVYISNYKGSFWLTYVVTTGKEKKFIGRRDVRLH